MTAKPTVPKASRIRRASVSDAICPHSRIGTSQLALRHPAFKKRPTARFAKQFGEDLEKEIVRLDPKLAMAAAAGWNPKFDR